MTNVPIIGLPAGFLETSSTAASRQISAAELASTVVLPSAEEKFDIQKSALWCASFQLAWDSMHARFPKAQFTSSPKNQTVELLAAHSFPTQAVDSSCVEITTAINDVNRVPKIALDCTFTKSLQFVREFEELRNGMNFTDPSAKSALVTEFGVPAGYGEGIGKPVWTDTIFVRDYISNEDFVLEIATRSAAEDRLILARCTPQNSLIEIWREVDRRIAQPHKWHDRPHLMSVDSFSAPVIDLDIKKQFAQLMNVQLIKDDRTVGIIAGAEQSLKLRLDRKGTSLISKATLVLTQSADDDEPPRKARHFALNKPFFMALIEGDAEQPYFLAWIANPEIMIPYEAEQTE